MKKVHVLVIDPQVDFCDPAGSLYVNGADKDMERLAAMIKRLKDKIDDIHVTLDSHHFVDVAHPIMWRDSKGSNPAPFTIISKNDVVSGVWTPAMPSLTTKMIAYLDALETSGRYPLCIWPPHCLIGSNGASVYPVLFDSLVEWEKEFAMVDYVTKGSNIYTEHYSAVLAEVPDAEDASTQINTGLINTLMEADIIAIAGEAGSHCVANTVRDIANNFNDDSYIQKLVILTDAISPVTGFEKNQDDFIAEMTKRGMQLSTTTEFLK